MPLRLLLKALPRMPLHPLLKVLPHRNLPKRLLLLLPSKAR
jgi:hypothetical protein